MRAALSVAHPLAWLPMLAFWSEPADGCSPPFAEAFFQGGQLVVEIEPTRLQAWVADLSKAELSQLVKIVLSEPGAVPAEISVPEGRWLLYPRVCSGDRGAAFAPTWLACDF